MDEWSEARDAEEVAAALCEDKPRNRVAQALRALLEGDRMTCDLAALVTSIRRLREEGPAPSPELALSEALAEALIAACSRFNELEEPTPHGVNRWLDQADEELTRIERAAGLRVCRVFPPERKL